MAFGGNLGVCSRAMVFWNKSSLIHMKVKPVLHNQKEGRGHMSGGGTEEEREASS